MLQRGLAAADTTTTACITASAFCVCGGSHYNSNIALGHEIACEIGIPSKMGSRSQRLTASMVTCHTAPCQIAGWPEAISYNFGYLQPCNLAIVTNRPALSTTCLHWAGQLLEQYRL